MRGEQRQRRRCHAVDPPGLANGSGPNRFQLLPHFHSRARSCRRSRTPRAAPGLRRADRPRHRPTGGPDRPSIWRRSRSAARYWRAISASCGQIRITSAMPMFGYDSRSIALRRWPSFLSARPCRSASFGVTESDCARLPGLIERRGLGAERRRPRRPDAADRDALRGQPLIGIVGAQGQPVLGARREHAVRLGDAARHQIVDHHAEIALGAIEHDLARRPRPRGGVETRHKSLRGSLFVAGRAVDLAGQEQPGAALGLERGAQLARIDMVVFDRVAGPHHAGLFQPRNAATTTPSGPPPAARSRCRSDRPWCRRGPRARGKSGARRARRSARSCPRSTGNSAGRGSRSARNTSASGAHSPG